MWQFAGPDDYTQPTRFLDFSLVQPLLRAGGRTRVMERLTIAERALLANVRQMEHYRRELLLERGDGRRDFGRTGRTAAAASSAAAAWKDSAASAAAASARSAASAARFSGKASASPAAPARSRPAVTSACLQTAQIIRNQYSNIAALGDSVEQLQAAHDAGRIDRFQVDLARQALYNAQSQLLNSADASTKTSLDNFKVQYGLPPDLDAQRVRPDAGSFQSARSEVGGAADASDRRARHAARGRAMPRRGAKQTTSRAAASSTCARTSRAIELAARATRRAGRPRRPSCGRVARSNWRSAQEDFAQAGGGAARRGGSTRSGWPSARTPEKLEIDRRPAERRATG